MIKPVHGTIAFLLLAATPPVSADIENIIVTASRTPVIPENVGSAITIITRDEIRRRGASNLADLLRDVPGLAVSQQGSLGAVTQVRARGAEANHLLVLIDGIEANDIAQGSEFNFAHILAGDVARVEIVRGPQSALWGSDALAGVVNIITEPGAGTRNGVDGQFEVGSFGALAGGVSGNLETSRTGMSFGIARHTTDGTNISRTGSERDGYHNTTVRLGGRLRLGEDVRLSVSGRHTDTLTDFDDVDFIATGLPVDAPFQTQSRQLYGRIALDARVTDHVEQIVALTRTDSHNVNLTTGPVPESSFGTKDALHLQTNIMLGQQTVSLVAEHEREDYENRGTVTFFGDPNKSHKANTTSAAVEVRHDGDRINLSASLRYDSNAEFDDALSWRTTGLWRVTGTTGLFASVGKSVKNPSFTERFGFFDTFFGNPDLEPEQSRAFEVGLRQSLLEDTLTFSASYYSAKLENEIMGFVFDADLAGFTAANSGDKSDREGVEAAFSWQATGALSVQGSYTWLDSTDPAAVTEVRRPRNSGSLRVNYGLERLNVNVGIVATGDQEDDYFPPFPPFQERVVLDSHVLMSVATQFRVNESVTLTARIENALDESYEEVFGYRNPGRAFYGGVRISF